MISVAVPLSLKVLGSGGDPEAVVCFGSALYL